MSWVFFRAIYVWCQSFRLVNAVYHDSSPHPCLAHGWCVYDDTGCGGLVFPQSQKRTIKTITPPLFVPVITFSLLLHSYALLSKFCRGFTLRVWRLRLDSGVLCYKWWPALSWSIVFGDVSGRWEVRFANSRGRSFRYAEIGFTEFFHPYCL